MLDVSTGLEAGIGSLDPTLDKIFAALDGLADDKEKYNELWYALATVYKNGLLTREQAEMIIMHDAIMATRRAEEARKEA